MRRNGPKGFSLCGLILVALILTNAAHALLKPNELTVEYRRNPLGIDVAQPRLSWLLKSNRPNSRGEMQSAYQVLVASSPKNLAADKGDLWDTGKQPSDQSIQIVYEGKPLASRQAVWWKVRVWDNSGEASPWSEVATWSMGLLSPEDWLGKWIGLDAGDRKPEELRRAKWIGSTAGGEKIYLRREVNLRDKPAEVLGQFIGTNSTAVYINGRKAETPKRTEGVIAGDMTGLFKPGRNVVEVSVQVKEESPAAVIGILEIDTPDSEEIVVRTDEMWTGSSELPKDWLSSEPLPLHPVKLLGDYGVAPWGEVGFADRTALRARMLRKEFRAETGMKRATAYVSGLGWFELYLNGRKVSDDVLVPALSDYDKRVYYLTYDVTQILKKGANAVGVMLGNGRFFSPRAAVGVDNRSFDYPRLLMQVEIEYENGNRAVVGSDTTWKLTDNGPVGYNNEYDGEDYDARKELQGWSLPGFNDTAWRNAALVNAPKGKLMAQPIAPIRVNETIQPVKLEPHGANRYVFDLGQNIAGWVHVKASGPAGAQIRIRHSETLRPDGALYINNLRTARGTDTYTMKGSGEEEYEPHFVYHGFRYVEVTTSPGVSVPEVVGRVVYDTLEQTSTFETSNPLLNKIHQNIVWGTKDNYHSIPTDCPQRDERMGWLGDRAASSRGEMYMFNNAALYSKWLADIEDTQMPDGTLSDVAPAYWRAYSDNVTWPASFIVVPRHLYEHQWDRRVIEQHYPAMKKWLEHIAKFRNEDLVAKDTYGDWCVPPESPHLIHSEDPTRRTDGEVLASSYYYYLLRLMADNARLLGKESDAQEFDDSAERVKFAFNRKYFHPETNTYSNGTQTSSIIPLAFGIVPEDRRQQVFDVFVRKLEEQNKGHVGTGLIGIQWLMRTLTDNGRADMAYEIASQRTYPSWGYMVEHGATTIWELWNGDTADPAMNSGNHLMLVGDLGVWFYERLAGIRPDPVKPGFKHIVLKPSLVDGLTFVKASIKSPHGVIKSGWERKGDHLLWNLQVPPNTTATVYVPANSVAGVVESGKSASSSPSVKFVGQEGSEAVYEIGSGSYSFESELITQAPR